MPTALSRPRAFNNKGTFDQNRKMKPLAWAAGAYVNLMRSIPLVLVIFWFFFLVPYIGQWITGAEQPIRVGAFASCLITFIKVTK